jgi:prealbumin domain-containing protein
MTKAARRRKHVAAVASATVLLGVFGLVGTSLAAPNIGTVGTAASFEDNDASQGTASNDYALNQNNSGFLDWNSFASQTYSHTAPYRSFGPVVSHSWEVAGFEDAAASGTDTGFAGGVKQDSDCGTLNPGKAPNKDDLARVYVASQTINGHVFLELSWVRIPQNNTSASAHVGYEFNQASSGDCSQAALTGMQHKLVKRTGGDMLVVYNFEGGSVQPVIKLSRWLNSDFHPTGATCEVNTSSPTTGCWGGTVDLTASGFAEGAVNFFNTKTKFSSTDNLKPSGAVNPGNAEFGEAGIDLTDANVFTAGQCETFGRAYAVSRSSGNSSQAAMEDIVGPGAFSLTNCGSVNVVKSGSDGDTAAQAGATFGIWAGDNADTTATDALDTCTVDDTGACLNDTSGTTPSFPDLQPGDYTVHEISPPDGYTAADDQNVTVGTSSTPIELDFTDQALPGSIQITKVDDTGEVVNGAVFTAYNDQAETDPAGNCTTGDGSGTSGTPDDGTCAIVGLDPGTYYVDEVPPSGYAKDPSVTWPVEVTVTKGDSGTPASVSATDPRTFKAIVIVCRESDGTLYPSDVTIDGHDVGNSLSAAGAGTAGLDESKLCALTDGARGGLTATDPTSNPYTAGVDIPHSQP